MLSFLKTFIYDFSHFRFIHTLFLFTYIGGQVEAGNKVYNPEDYESHDERVAQTGETEGRLVAQLYIITVEPTT